MQILLFFISFFFGIFTFIYFAIKRKTLTIEVVSFIPFLYLTFFASLYEFVFTYLLKIDAEYWFRLYMFLEFLCIYYFYDKIFQKQNTIRRLLFISLLLYIVFYLVLLFYWKPHDNLKTDSYLSVYNTVTIILFSIFWFKRIFINFEISNLFNSPTFIIISGLLLYYTSTLFLFLISDYILKDRDNSFLDYWQINVVFLILFRFFLLLGIKKSIRL